MRINIVVVINQTHKHKAKIYNHCTYTHNYYKGVMHMFERCVKMCEFCGYIVAFKIIFSIKRGHESIFRFVSILFKCDFKCKFFLA